VSIRHTDLKSQQFNRNLYISSTPCSSYPKISGKEIDLHDLYKLVCTKGGWLKVNARDQWDEVLAAFKVPNGPNSALVLKQIYVRYLDQFEKVNFLGEAADRNEDEEDENRHKKWTVRALHRKTVPMTYNYAQHVVPEQLRAAHKLSTDFYRPTEYDKLLMSLMSPLPNEQDFAINVCTLMSNEERHTIKIAKCPRLVYVLLAHAGIFHHCECVCVLSSEIS
jgi:AT-rich interactive domain-containing protein 2